MIYQATAKITEDSLNVFKIYKDKFSRFMINTPDWIVEYDKKQILTWSDESKKWFKEYFKKNILTV